MLAAHPSTGRTNIPAQLTSFVGREHDRIEGGRLLAGARLLTLTGAGGIGKTRLALEIADDQAGDYRDGVWLVELAPVSNPGLVSREVASILGLRDDPASRVLDQLVAHLLDRQLLLVLDNCEHLAFAAAQMVHHLLRSCPALRVLATSREALNLPGEVAWPVPPLSAESGVRLFVERAKAVSPAFAEVPIDDRGIASVCERLDGLPLAIELAAARTRILSVEQIAERLDDRFRLLTTGPRTAAPRHQALRFLVDWSYDLLSSAEQALFSRLSVFSGGWTLEAAEVVCGADVGRLASLVDKSMALARIEPGAARYGMLETLRQYAAGKLGASPEAGEMHQRHLSWVLDLATRAREEFRGPAQAAWFDRLEAELDNVRAALQWSKGDPSALQDGLRLAGLLEQFWWLRGRASEGRQWLRALLAQAEEDPSIRRTEARTWALDASAFLARRQGDLRATRSLAEEALAGWRALGRVDRVAFVLRELGRLAIQEKRFEEARQSLEESLALSHELGQRRLVYEAVFGLAELAEACGDPRTATDLYEQALALEQEEGDAWYMHLSLLRLGGLALDAGDLDGARARLGDSLALARQGGERAGVAPTLAALARFAAAEGRPERAMRLAGAATALRRAVGAGLDRGSERALAAVRGGARRALGETAAAAAWAAGEAMSLEDAVDFALAGHAPPRARPVAALTAREHEVVTLLARGLTNREIAAELVVTEGTAKRHVENILAKLGLASRAQVAAWAARDGAVGGGATPVLAG